MRPSPKLERGELEAVLSLLSEGKARLMSVALRQQSLDLPPDKRARYATIRAEIREWAGTSAWGIAG
jgi:hypothetical protein